MVDDVGQCNGRVDVFRVEVFDSLETGFAGCGIFSSWLQDVQDVKLETCPAGLFELAFEVAAQDSQEGCGGWAEGKGDEQGAFFAWFRVFHSESFEALDDFRLHVFAEAGFADGFGADGDCYGFGVAAFAEVGCGCGWRW